MSLCSQKRVESMKKETWWCEWDLGIIGDERSEELNDFDGLLYATKTFTCQVTLSSNDMTTSMKSHYLPIVKMSHHPIIHI
jgi:hypothetical protein